MVSRISRLQKSQAEAEPELDSSLALLVKIDPAGSLDSLVLFNQADAGIAQDYSAFRAAHRDRFDRYMDEIWTSSPCPKRLNLQQTPGNRGSASLQFLYRHPQIYPPRQTSTPPAASQELECDWKLTS
jgi:hypothetical protein